MQLNVQFDSKYLEARTLKEQKRLAYNTAQALNNAAKSIQADVRAEMAKDFHLRNASKSGKQWLLQRIKVKFASVRKGVMAAEVYVDQKPRLLLGQFETGGERLPFVGKNIAVPNPEQARAGGSVEGSVLPALTFAKLGLKPVDVTPHKQGDSIQFKGSQRTFLLKSTAKNPMGGVYQRVGPGKDDIRLVYSFHRAFQLHRLLHLVQTAKANFQEKFRIELSIAYARNPVDVSGNPPQPAP